MPGPIVEGQPICRLHIDKTDPAATIDVTYKPTYRIAFGEGFDSQGHPLTTNGKRILLTLNSIHDAVWSILRDLQPYFTKQVTFTITFPSPPES